MKDSHLVMFNYTFQHCVRRDALRSHVRFCFSCCTGLLDYQRFFLWAVSIISIGFVLPVNLLSTFSKDRGDWLDRASAGNVDPYHWGVWVLWVRFSS